MLGAGCWILGALLQRLGREKSWKQGSMGLLAKGFEPIPSCSCSKKGRGIELINLGQDVLPHWSTETVMGGVDDVNIPHLGMLNFRVQ